MGARKPNAPHRIVGLTLLVVVALGGAGCRETKPPDPKVTAFRQEVHTVLQRLVPSLAEPVSREDRAAVQKVLVRLFGLCAADCQGVMDNVFVLDKDSILIAVYPPEKVKTWQYADYAPVRGAIEKRKPTQAVLYRADGGTLYVIFAPLLHQGQVRGILGLVFEGATIQDKKGITQQVFLSLDIQNP